MHVEPAWVGVGFTAAVFFAGVIMAWHRQQSIIEQCPRDLQRLSQAVTEIQGELRTLDRRLVHFEEHENDGNATHGRKA